MYSPIMIEGEHRQGKMKMKETWRELEGGCAEANDDDDGMYAGGDVRGKDEKRDIRRRVTHGSS